MDAGNKRVDKASKVIKASPETIYNAHLDKDAIAAWRAPKGMTCYVHLFEPKEGGRYKMELVYPEKSDDAKTTDNSDVLEGTFLELIPNEKIVEETKFESDKPGFEEKMLFTTTLKEVGGGTEVSFSAENVPEAISKEDHFQGMMSSLNNLASFVE